MSNKLLIKNGHLLTMNKRLETFERADMLIEDGEIVTIAPDLKSEDAEIIDAEDMIVMPGLIDTHRHVWHSIVKGLAADMSFAQFMTHIPGKIGNKFRSKDLYLANLLGALEALHAGVTTVVDWSNIIHSEKHAEQAIKGLLDAGIRGVFTYGLPYEITFQHKQIKQLVKTYFSSSEQLLSLAIGTLSPEYVPLSIPRRDIHLGRQLGLTTSMHIGSGGSKGGIKQLVQAQLLGEDLNFVHCNTLEKEEFKQIANSGASVSITPEVEMQMGLGMPATQQILEYHGKISIGIDVASATSGDLFTQMRMLLQVHRALQNEKRLIEGETPNTIDLTAEDAVKIATIYGARAIGMDKKIGSLEQGKKADLIFIRKKDLNIYPVHTPYVSVLQAHADNVDSVFVEGKAVKRHGKLLYADLKQIRSMAQSSFDHIFNHTKK